MCNLLDSNLQKKCLFIHQKIMSLGFTLIFYKALAFLKDLGSLPNH